MPWRPAVRTPTPDEVVDDSEMLVVLGLDDLGNNVLAGVRLHELVERDGRVWAGDRRIVEEFVDLGTDRLDLSVSLLERAFMRLDLRSEVLLDISFKIRKEVFKR